MIGQQGRDPSQMPGFRERYVATVSWMALLCQVLEASVVVFLRKGFGARYLGGQAAAVLPLVMLYSLGWQGRDVSALWGFLAFYLFGIVLARIGSARRARKGEITHSHYSGRPCVLDSPLCKRWLTERAAKLYVEPMLVVLTGVFFMGLSEPLGTYLIIAAFGLMASMRMSIAFERKQIMDARDAFIAQRHLAERFREGGWQ